MGAAQPGALVAYRTNTATQPGQDPVEPAPLTLGREPAQHRGEIGDPAQHGSRRVELAQGGDEGGNPLQGGPRRGVMLLLDPSLLAQPSEPAAIAGSMLAGFAIK